MPLFRGSRGRADILRRYPFEEKKTFFQHGTLLRIEYLENLCACRPTCPKKCGTGCNSCERTERKSKFKVVLKASFLRENCGRLWTVRAIDRRDRSLEISSEVIFTKEWVMRTRLSVSPSNVH